MNRYWSSIILLGGLLAPVAGQAQNYGREVSCESNDGRYRECRVSYRGPAAIVRQMSDTRCVEGRNWGSRPGLIWVDQGCRARFAESRRDWPDHGRTRRTSARSPAKASTSAIANATPASAAAPGSSASYPRTPASRVAAGARKTA